MSVVPSTAAEPGVSVSVTAAEAATQPQSAAGVFVADPSPPKPDEAPLADLGFSAGFAAGVRIATDRGWTAVEDLRPGDRVKTVSGALRPVKAVARRAVDCAQASRPEWALPISVAANALGPDIPLRDVHLAPRHALCLDVYGEALVPAYALVNGASIRQLDTDKVTFVRVELDSHDILITENLAVESSFGIGLRDAAAEPDAPAPTAGAFCRPFHAEGPLVTAVQRQLAARARSLGWHAEPRLEIHVLADGRRLEPTIAGHTATFPLPRGDFWLVSSTTRPADLAVNEDCRDLGVCLAALAVEAAGAAPHAIPLDDPRLSVGFWDIERDPAPFRWTSRRALFPAALFEGAPEGALFKIEMRGEPLARWTAPGAG